VAGRRLGAHQQALGQQRQAGCSQKRGPLKKQRAKREWTTTDLMPTQNQPNEGRELGDEAEKQCNIA
jgi:hypothetical protein